MEIKASRQIPAGGMLGKNQEPHSPLLLSKYKITLLESL